MTLRRVARPRLLGSHCLLENSRGCVREIALFPILLFFRFALRFGHVESCHRSTLREMEGALLCERMKSSARLLNLKESAANHCAFQISNNSAQFSPCSLLPALLLASALNPRKRISQTHLSSRDHSTARPCQRNPALFSPEEFRSKARSSS